MAQQRQDFPLVGSYDNQRQTVISAARTVNMFEYIDPKGKRPQSLISTPGMVDTEIDFSTQTTHGARASFVYKNIMYQVFGAAVYRFTAAADGSLSYSYLGGLSNDSGHVGIDANTFQILFVDGNSGYVHDLNSGLWTQVTDSGFPTKPIDCCALDGFMVVANGQTNNFQLSSLEQAMVWSGGDGTAPTFTADTGTDILTLSTTNANFALGVPVTVSNSGGALPTPLVAGTTYYSIPVSAVTTTPGTIRLATSYANAIAGTYIDITVAGAPTNSLHLTGQLQLGSITSHPGNIVACRTLHRRLFLFSDYFIEVWENQGAGNNLPFRRNNSLLMEVGTPAIGSIVSAFDRMFFLAQNSNGLDSVMEVKGAQPFPVSNRALEYQLSQYAANPEQRVSDAVGLLTREDGLIFYKLNFTRANHTFVYGVTMSEGGEPKWHEEEVLNGDRHPAQTHVYFNGLNYYGDYSQAKLYYSDSNVCTNNGEAIKRMRIAQTIAPPGYYRTRIDRFHVDLLQGNVPITSEEFNLDAEDGLDLLAEDDQMLLLEQQLNERSGQPPVFLSYSKDGGQWYGYVQQGSMGKLGERTYRTIWRKLGTIPRGQGFTVKIEFYSDIPFIVLGASWCYETMPE